MTLILIGVSLSLTISIQLALAHPNDISERATLSPVSVVSTRNLTGDLKLNMEELMNKRLTSLVEMEAAHQKLPFIFMVLTETNPKLERNLIEYNHH